MLNFRLCILFAIFFVGQAFAQSDAPYTVTLTDDRRDEIVRRLLKEVGEINDINLNYVPQATEISAQIVPQDFDDELVVSIKLTFAPGSFITGPLNLKTSGLSVQGASGESCAHTTLEGEDLVPNNPNYFSSNCYYGMVPVPSRAVHAYVIKGIRESLVRALVGHFLEHGQVNGKSVTLQAHYDCALNEYKDSSTDL